MPAMIATTTEPALEGVKAELDLTWRMTRVRVNGSRLSVVSPLVEGAEELAIARAFSLACTRRARLTAVGSSESWRLAVEREAERWQGVVIDHRDFEAVVPVLFREPGVFDVLLSEQVFAEMAELGVELLSGEPRTAAEEAPFAYKDIDAVMAASADLVRPVLRLRPLGVVKG